MPINPQHEPLFVETASSESSIAHSHGQRKREHAYGRTILSKEENEFFQWAWDQYPKTNTRNEPLIVGSKKLAQKYWRRIIDARLATPQQLAACWSCYANRVILGVIRYPGHFSTFFGPEQELFREYLEEAKELLRGN